MTLISETIQKVRVYYPNSELRYTNDDLIDLIHAADCMLKEVAPVMHGSYAIELLDGVRYYVLPTDIVNVMSVRYSSTGSTENNIMLHPVSIRELDEYSPQWTLATGEPAHYSLKSCPGMDGSYIMIYPPGDGHITIDYTAYYPTDTAEGMARFLASEVDSLLIDSVYVPYVLATIFAGENYKKFEIYMSKFMTGIAEAEAHNINRYPSLEGYRHNGSGFSSGGLL